MMQGFIADAWKRVRQRVAETDLVLLIFLLLMCNYRFSFKILALTGIYILRPNFKFRRDGVTLFYALMIVLALINGLFIHTGWTWSHWGVILTRCMIWTACLLAFHQVRTTIESNETHRTLNALKGLAIFNCIASCVDLVMIIYATKTLNPYSAVSAPPYGISSGDLIGGAFGGMHLVNTIISAFLLVFFIYSGRFFYVFVCLVPFLLTGSNLGTIIVTAVLVYAIITVKGTLRKYYALFCIPIIYIFYVKVTPDNARYLSGMVSKITSGRSHVSATTPKPLVVEKPKPTNKELIDMYVAWRYRTRPAEEKALVWPEERRTVYDEVMEYESNRKHTAQNTEHYVFYKKDSLKNAKKNSSFFEFGKLKKFDFESESGKLTSFRQTVEYMDASAGNAIFGSGPGGFSSRLAFISSRIVDDSRILKLAPSYETQEFRDNHKAIFKYLMYMDDSSHSITNLPFCWYNQLAGEYGIAGILIFAVFYIRFFLKRIRWRSFGPVLLVLMIAFFLFDYWYERLSVMIMFELLMLLDLKLNIQQKSDEASDRADAGV